MIDQHWDDGPDPATASSPAQFIERLNELRTWAGNPSLRRLQRLAGSTETSTGDEVDALPVSTLSYVLTGKGLPRLPRMAFVEALVTACCVACGQPERDILPRWLSAWRDLARQATASVRQLPMDIGEFTGRQPELARLRTVLAPAAAVVTIEGMAGVGKTRLAVHAAHELASSGRYNDIQLWADLRGFDPEQRRADPAEVLASFLRLLGVPNARMPRSLDERAALYRDRLSDREALVLLDNAATAEQVRPLLPGGPNCLVLITTRHSLSELDGAEHLPLAVFTADESVALLGRVVGADRVAAELEAAQRIAELCGHLPIAVALAARRLRARPAWRLADLAERLETEDDRRLDQLAGGDCPLRASFDLSYHCLSPQHQRAFRLLGVHPGADITPHSAAALTAIPVEDAERTLETLLDEHLLRQEETDRYHFHDLIRYHARNLTTATDPPDTPRLARQRCLTWYLHTADAAWQTLEPRRRRTFDLPAAENIPPPLDFTDYDDALSWCEAERANLVAAVHAAADDHLTTIAWQLPAVLLRYFYLRSHWADWLDTHQVALVAAQKSGKRSGEAKILNGLGVAYGDLRQFDEAIAYCGQAATIFGELGDAYGQAWSLNNLGVTTIHQHRPADALDHLERALTLFRHANDAHGEAICLNNLGDAHRRLHQPTQAITYLHQATTLQKLSGDRPAQRYTLLTLGDLYHDTGHPTQALDHYHQALAISRAAHDRRATARILHHLAQTLHTLGHATAARTHLDQAATILATLNTD
jgi:tetratricopeptide (TPR) repeat protein